MEIKEKEGREKSEKRVEMRVREERAGIGEVSEAEK